MTRTTPGTVMGTPAYMSPEQARGEETDSRTDIWGFGCVLFEVLTGSRAFSGRTVSDTLAAVLTAEPTWDELPEPQRVVDKVLAGRGGVVLMHDSDRGADHAKYVLDLTRRLTAAAETAGLSVMTLNELLATEMVSDV